MQIADFEGKPWKSFISNFLFNYRATPHALTQVSPPDLLHGCPFCTKQNIKNFASLDASVHPAVLKDQVDLKQAKVKCYVDESRGTQSPQFKCGSYVRVKKPGIMKK